METVKNLSALLQFNSVGELKHIFLNVDTDEQEKTLKQALSKLIRPTLFGWVIGKLS